MKAALITIGDEILSGTTIDTNSNYIASQLRSIGISTVRIFTVSDEVATIENTLAEAFGMADLIITTGGLGPTKDDRTKTAFKNFFCDELRLDPETFSHLEKLLIRRNRQDLLEINRAQAEVLGKAVVFQNDNGTAPCQMLIKDGKYIFCLPGVPYEVKPLIKNKILPFLKENFHLHAIVTRTVSVVNYPESLLSQAIESWELALPQNVALSYLPVGNRIKLKLTASGTDETELSKTLDAEVQKLKPFIADRTIAWYGNDINEILGEVMASAKLSLSVAESCTGGELARLITAVPGCSAYFTGGAVVYAEAQKTKLLKVPEETMKTYSVVSEEVAQAMSQGCRNLFATDIALATTGVAGPDTDEYGTEVGTVFYSVRVKDYEYTNRLFLPHLDRKDFMNFVSQRVLQDLVEILVKQHYA